MAPWRHQVRLFREGLWHKVAHDDPEHTACGQSISGPIATRDRTLLGDLCPVCFSRHELDTGAMRKLIRELAGEARDLYYDDDDDPTPPDGIPTTEPKDDK